MVHFPRRRVPGNVHFPGTWVYTRPGVVPTMGRLMYHKAPPRLLKKTPDLCSWQNSLYSFLQLSQSDLFRVIFGFGNKEGVSGLARALSPSFAIPNTLGDSGRRRPFCQPCSDFLRFFSYLAIFRCFRPPFGLLASTFGQFGSFLAHFWPFLTHFDQSCSPNFFTICDHFLATFWRL